jgi:hypothetical protein
MQALSLDIKQLARERSPSQPRHSLLPPPILAFTRHWLNLADGFTPRWPQFDMLDVADAVPYLTVLKARGERAFDVEFVGSAVTALTDGLIAAGKVIIPSSVLGDIAWVGRAKLAMDLADIQVATGSVNPPYTSSIEYVSADFPFLGEAGAAVETVACVTIPKVN